MSAKISKCVSFPFPFQLLSSCMQLLRWSSPCQAFQSHVHQCKLFSQMCTPGGKLPLAHSWVTNSDASEPFCQDKDPMGLPLAWCLFWGLCNIFKYLAPCCHHWQILASAHLFQSSLSQNPWWCLAVAFWFPRGKKKDDPRCLFSLIYCEGDSTGTGCQGRWVRLHPHIYSKSDWPWSWQTSSTVPEEEDSV